MQQKIYVDGSGDGRYFWLNKTTKKQKLYREEALTNNQAEYLSIYHALMENKGEIEILSDSRLAVNQLNGNWRIKDEDLKKLFDKIQEIIKSRNLKVTFTWISRKYNLAGKYLG